MAYQVLARKYRPQRFSDVIGQEHVTQTLLNALAQDRIAHGYIFSGHRGIGKTTIARILAMALQCRTTIGSPERLTPEPCGVCDACTEIRAGNAMDVIEIDAATNRGIDEIRELREGARYSPARDKYKIYILDEAHQITDAAFNALLKTLEEPPAHVVFMMATTQPEDIPQTIRSRCQHFSFHAVRFHEIVEQLRSIAGSESVQVDEGALSLLAEAGDGSMRDALSIMDQAIASAPLVDGNHVLDSSQIRSLMGTVSNQIFEDMMQAVHERNTASMMEQAAHLLDAGNSPQQIARQMVRFLRNCLMTRVAGTKSELLQVSDEERLRSERVAAMFSEEDLTRFLNSMLRTFDDLGYRQEQRFHLELGLLKLVHMQRLLPFEELFRQLSGSSGTSHGSPSSSPRPLNSGVASAAAKTPQLSTTSAESAKAEGLSSKSFSAEKAPPVSLNSSPARTLPAVSASQTAPTPHPLDGMFLKTSIASRENTAIAPQSVEISQDVELADADTGKPAELTTASQDTSRPEASAPSIATALAQVSESSESAQSSALDAEALRTQISAAMVQGGHETAGSMFEAGLWEWDGAELRIRIGASKTLLGLIYTAQAQQIVRETFRTLTGSNKAVKVEPGEPLAIGQNKTVDRPAVRNSADTIGQPQDHPLIRHAQELFHAEVRSVVSLRTPR